MMRNTLGLSAALVLSSLAGCGDNLTGPSDGSDQLQIIGVHADDVANNAIRLTVMTRNLFVGTDVDRLIGVADPNQIPFIVADLWELLLANDAEDRMAAVAREIAEHRPHLVGLQEVSTFRVQHPADFQVNAESVLIDFVPSLLAQLAALGANYRIVAQVQNMDVELPRLNPDFSLTDVRVTDYDVILARDDVQTSMPFEANYAASWFLAPGIEIARGLTAVDATIDGKTFRFVNTHPEPVETQGGSVQSLQAAELIGLLTPESRPTILLGDLNTEASTGDTYGMLIGAGFLDVFDLRRQGGSGDLTCCHSVDLSSDDVALVKRVDHVMLRNFDGLWPAAGNPPIDVKVLGDWPAEKSAGGLWPSDHAGIVATMVLPRPGS